MCLWWLYCTLWRRNEWGPGWKVLHVPHFHLLHTCAAEVNTDMITQVNKCLEVSAFYERYSCDLRCELNYVNRHLLIKTD